MAYSFPPSPVGLLPPGVLRAFQALKALPADFVVWHHLAPWAADAPDFLVLNPQRRAVLLKVCPDAAGDARPTAQLLLLEDERPPLGEKERRILERCREEAGLAGEQAALGIIFPNLSRRLLAECRPPDCAGMPAWLGKEDLQPGSPAWEPLFTGAALDFPAQERLRALVAPEVLVPPALTVRRPSDRRLAAGLTGFLLDYDQEAALKTGLDLPAEGQSLARDFRTSLVNGVAGSGKTLILLYRLRLLNALYPGKRFLVLTHNRPLIRDMQARFHHLQGGLPDNIAWHTFMGWCREHWPEGETWVEPLGQGRRRQRLRAAWAQVVNGHPSGAGLSESMLRSEIDWLKDQPDSSLDAYLQADRRGRGFRLGREQRRLMYAAFQRYQELLGRQGEVDWGDVPRRLWACCGSGRVVWPQYDAILVDEAQFFAPLWFEIIRRLLRLQQGHLFLAADPTQGFLGRGSSWRSLGLDVRGHSHHLKRSYRTTLEILNFAAGFYRERVPASGDDEDVLTPDLTRMPNGAIPQLVPLSSPQDEIARAANEIEALVKQGFPRRDILAIHANWEGARDLIRALERRLGRMAAADPKEQYPGNYVRVTTLNAGTGLESPVVFLLGLRQLFEEEQSLRLGEEERERIILENTRKIYMAVTRAGQRLVLTYVGPLPPGLSRLATYR